MKRSDIAVIIIVASVSVLVSFFATRAIFGGAANEPVNVLTVDKISDSIVEPDSAIFNENAINPSVEVKVGADSK